MGRIFLGLNTEYTRASDKPFESAVEHAARMGYRHLEQRVHLGRSSRRPSLAAGVFG